jgi:hypothetical protein
MPSDTQNMRMEFSSGDATLSAYGREVTGFKKVGYNSKQKAVVNKTGNNKSTSYSFGDVDDEFKIELYMTQLRDWELQAKQETGSSSLLKRKVVLSVTYFNEELEETTDVITFVILSQGRAVEGGADGLAYELETLCLGIEFDA